MNAVIVSQHVKACIVMIVAYQMYQSGRYRHFPHAWLSLIMSRTLVLDFVPLFWYIRQEILLNIARHRTRTSVSSAVTTIDIQPDSAA